MKTSSKIQKRLDRLYGAKGPLTRDFCPKGRSGYFIYAITLKEHPSVVKVGRTSKWKSRRQSYANWNLSDGGAIQDERVFCITDEFVDLESLERHILTELKFERRHGKEWLIGNFEEVCRQIDRILCECGISAI